MCACTCRLLESNNIIPTDLFVKVKEEGEGGGGGGGGGGEGGGGEEGGMRYQKHTFKFSMRSLSQSVPSINWTPLTTSETTFPHIRIHQLRADDSLSYFMATLSSIPAAMAIVLISPSTSHTLPGKYGEGEEVCPPVPLLVVTRETGEELMTLVEEHPRVVEVKVGGANISRPHSLEFQREGSCKHMLTLYMYMLMCLHVYAYMFMYMYCTCT